MPTPVRGHEFFPWQRAFPEALVRGSLGWRVCWRARRVVGDDAGRGYERAQRPPECVSAARSRARPSLQVHAPGAAGDTGRHWSHPASRVGRWRLSRNLFVAAGPLGRRSTTGTRGAHERARRIPAGPSAARVAQHPGGTPVRSVPPRAPAVLPSAAAPPCPATRATACAVGSSSPTVAVPAAAGLGAGAGAIDARCPAFFRSAAGVVTAAADSLRCHRRADRPPDG